MTTPVFSSTVLVISPTNKTRCIDVSWKGRGPCLFFFCFFFREGCDYAIKRKASIESVKEVALHGSHGNSAPE